MVNPFAKHIPSVFVVDTPFQSLCAIAAIRQLELEDYLLLVYLPKDGARNEQMRLVFKEYGIRCKFVNSFGRITLKVAIWLSKRKRRSKYSRLFIGDLRDLNLYFVGLRYVDDGAEVIYLDDGNITISLLNDIMTEPLSEWSVSYLKKIELKRNIQFNRNFLTVYGDIENPKYHIMNLNLNLIVSKKCNASVQAGIYIIGTNIERYCGPLGIPYKTYINKLEELVIGLRTKYPDEKITFIPHGMDKSEYAKEICIRQHIDFEPSKMTVELKLLSCETQPKVVYGFTSSALYNIKKIYPQTRVVNVLYECNSNNPFYQEYSIYSEYYLKNGIELKKESL